MELQKAEEENKSSNVLREDIQKSDNLSQIIGILKTLQNTIGEALDVA